MSDFQDGFFDTFEKIAKEFRPSTKRGVLMDNIKHMLYGGLGGTAGALIGGGIGKGKGAVIGSILGNLAGSTYSELRNKKRMKRRLEAQGLDPASMKKLEQQGHFKHHIVDAIPMHGRLRAAHGIRSALEAMGKKTRGHF